MSSPLPNKCLVSLEAQGRQFIFYVDPKQNVSYFHLPAGDGGSQYNFLGKVEVAGHPTVQSVSNWFADTVFRDQELRLYIPVHDPTDSGSHVLKEFCATVGHGTGKISWTEGPFSGSAEQSPGPSIKADSLITAMHESDGYPTVIFQKPNGALVKFHEAEMAGAVVNKTAWAAKNVTVSGWLS